MKSILICLLLIILLIIIRLFIDKLYTTYFIQNNEITHIYSLNIFSEENSISLQKLYNYPINLITILLINYLLITLIVIVKITNLYYGTLRLIN